MVFWIWRDYKFAYCSCALNSAFKKNNLLISTYWEKNSYFLSICPLDHIGFFPNAVCNAAKLKGPQAPPSTQDSKESFGVKGMSHAGLNTSQLLIPTLYFIILNTWN